MQCLEKGAEGKIETLVAQNFRASNNAWMLDFCRQKCRREKGRKRTSRMLVDVPKHWAASKNAGYLKRFKDQMEALICFMGSSPAAEVASFAGTDVCEFREALVFCFA